LHDLTIHSHITQQIPRINLYLKYLRGRIRHQRVAHIIASSFHSYCYPFLIENGSENGGSRDLVEDAELCFLSCLLNVGRTQVKVHVLYEPGNVILHVGNFTEEKSCVFVFEHHTWVQRLEYVENAMY
jgi:hypothetical protein